MSCFFKSSLLAFSQWLIRQYSIKLNTTYVNTVDLKLQSQNFKSMSLLKAVHISDSNWDYRLNRRQRKMYSFYPFAAWLEFNRIKNIKELQSYLVERKSSFQTRLNDLYDFKSCFKFLKLPLQETSECIYIII